MYRERLKSINDIQYNILYLVISINSAIIINYTTMQYNKIVFRTKRCFVNTKKYIIFVLCW